MTPRVEHTAIVTFDLAGHTSLDERDELIEKVRETAYPILSGSGRSVTVEWRAPDLWTLRGAVEDTLGELESNFRIRVNIDKVLVNAEATVE